MRAFLVITRSNTQPHFGARIPQEISSGESRMAALANGVVVGNALSFGDSTKIHLG